MRKTRLLSLGSIAAVLICLSLTGFPWEPREPMANFSGKLIFNADEQRVEISGRYHLYNCITSNPSIRVEIVCDQQSVTLDVDRFFGSFSGDLSLADTASTAFEARLVLDGEVVARGEVRLPGDGRSAIHILRFSSVS